MKKAAAPKTKLTRSPTRGQPRRRTRLRDPSSESETSDDEPAGAVPRSVPGRSSMASAATAASDFQFPARFSAVPGPSEAPPAATLGNATADANRISSGSAGTSSSFATRRAAMLRARKTLELEAEAQQSLCEQQDSKAGNESRGSGSSSSSSGSGSSGNSKSSFGSSGNQREGRAKEDTEGGNEDVGSHSQASGSAKHLPDWYLASAQLREVSGGHEDKRNCLQVLAGFLIDAGVAINNKIQHRGVPVACVVAGIVTTIALLVSLYYKEPSIKEGAFGHTTPVSLWQPILAGTFEEALWSAVSGQDLISTASSTLGGGDYTWRRIILTYKGLEASERDDDDDEEITTNTYIQLDKVQELEAKLRALPTWKSLCSSSVPSTHRRLCDPGDSYISIAFGSSVGVTDEGAAMGIVANITFDGLASYSELTSEELTDHLDRVASDSLLRWMPSGSDLNNIYALRTSFAFYLPEDVAESDWATFISEEVEPVLVENEEGESMRVFYIVDGSDGLEEREFQRALRSQFPILLVSPLATFLASLLVTQQFLLALTAFAVVLLAGAVDGAAAEIYDSIELPVMILAAWGCNCIVVTDLACASARAAEIWKFDSRLPPTPSYDPENPRHIIARSSRKALWFFLEVFAPPMASAFMLLLLSSTVIPLLNEFTWHAGSGILLCCGFGAVLFPAAVRLADLFARRGPRVISTQLSRTRTGSLRVEIAASCSYVCYMVAHTFLPVEVGARAPWKRKIGQKLAIFSVRFLPSLGVRIWAAVMFSIAVILVAVGETWPNFISDTPDLFVIGHRMRSWQAVRALFEPLPAASSILQNQLDDVYRCTVDAWDAAGCASHICDSSSTADSTEGCSCYYSRKSDTSTCGGVAGRLFGTEASPTVAEWQFLFEEVRERLVDQGDAFFDVEDADDITSRTVISDSGMPLSLEDWTSGSVYVQELSIGGISSPSSSSVPKMEEACDRLICFCGEKACDDSFTILTDGSWDLLCPSSSSSNCKIDFPPAATTTTTTTTLATTLSATASTTTLHITTTAATTTAQAATDSVGETTESGTSVDAIVVFGLQMPDEPTSRSSGTQGVAFQSSFDLRDLKTQRDLLAFCEGTHPEFGITARYCWPKDFRDWLREQNLMYPVEEEDFYSRLQGFLSEVDPYDMDNEYASAGHFWLDLDGRIGGFYAIFSAIIPEDVGSVEYLDVWNYYIDRRNNFTEVTNQSWLVLPIFVDEEIRDAVETGMVTVIWHFVAFTGVAALLLTWSCGLSCTVMLTLCVSVSYLGTISIWFGGRSNAGVLDVVMVTSFLSMSSTQLLRLVQQYSLGQEGPLKKKDDFDMSSMADRSTSHSEGKHEFFWLGSIDSEIRVRAAAALYRTTDTVLGIFLASTLVAPIFLATTLEGLAQVLVAMMCACYSSVPAVLTFCPVVLALGLGPSRIYNRAVKAVWDFKRAERDERREDKASGRRRSMEFKKHTPKQLEAELAAQLLGWPFTTLFPDLRSAPRKRRNWCPCGRLRGRSEIIMDIDEEDAPQVLALDIQGATAMPPFHITMTVKERLGSDG